MRFGRVALLGAGALYVALLTWSALVLPDRVPSHFDGAGRVDDWSSRTSMLVMWAVVGLVVLVGIPLLARLAAIGDGSLVNMPAHYKAYWFDPSRRKEFLARFTDDMEFFSAVTGLLLSVLLALTTWVGATGRDGAPSWAFVVLLGGYLAITVLWVVRLLRAYRPPVADD